MILLPDIALLSFTFSKINKSSKKYGKWTRNRYTNILITKKHCCIPSLIGLSYKKTRRLINRFKNWTITSTLAALLLKEANCVCRNHRAFEGKFSRLLSYLWVFLKRFCYHINATIDTLYCIESRSRC